MSPDGVRWNTSGAIWVQPAVAEQRSVSTVTFMASMLAVAEDQPCWRSKADSTALSDAVVMFGSVPIPHLISVPAELST